jgi:hypothetical protein
MSWVILPKSDLSSPVPILATPSTAPTASLIQFSPSGLGRFSSQIVGNHKYILYLV